MIIYDKYLDSYYEVIPVKKIEEKMAELKERIKKEKNTIILEQQLYILQQLIKENCKEEEWQHHLN